MIVYRQPQHLFSVVALAVSVSRSIFCVAAVRNLGRSCFGAIVGANFTGRPVSYYETEFTLSCLLTFSNKPLLGSVAGGLKTALVARSNASTLLSQIGL